MGRVQGTKRKRKSSDTDYTPFEYYDPGTGCASFASGYGEVRGSGDQVSQAELDAAPDWQKTAWNKACAQSEKGENKMNWFSWLKPKLTYFDHVTDLVNSITHLECRLRDDETACHERLEEIEAARREMRVRVFRA